MTGAGGKILSRGGAPDWLPETPLLPLLGMETEAALRDRTWNALPFRRRFLLHYLNNRAASCLRASERLRRGAFRDHQKGRVFDSRWKTLLSEKHDERAKEYGSRRDALWAFSEVREFLSLFGDPLSVVSRDVLKTMDGIIASGARYVPPDMSERIAALVAKTASAAESSPEVP